MTGILTPLILLSVAYTLHLHGGLNQIFPLISIVAIAALAAAVSAVYLVVGSMIGVYWRELNRGRLLRSLFEYLFVPYVSVTWIVQFVPSRLTTSLSLTAITAIAAASIIYSTRTRATLLASWQSANIDFQRFLLRYPLQRRSDLVLVDIAYLLMLGMPFLFSDAIFLQ